MFPSAAANSIASSVHRHHARFVFEPSTSSSDRIRRQRALEGRRSVGAFLLGTEDGSPASFSSLITQVPANFGDQPDFVSQRSSTPRPGRLLTQEELEEADRELTDSDSDDDLPIFTISRRGPPGTAPNDYGTPATEQINEYWKFLNPVTGGDACFWNVKKMTEKEFHEKWPKEPVVSIEIGKKAKELLDSWKLKNTDASWAKSTYDFNKMCLKTYSTSGFSPAGVIFLLMVMDVFG